MLPQGKFRAVFPVKCNHDRRLIENILRAGREMRTGLEAGSKAEVRARSSKGCAHQAAEGSCSSRNAVLSTSCPIVSWPCFIQSLLRQRKIRVFSKGVFVWHGARVRMTYHACQC